MRRALINVAQTLLSVLVPQRESAQTRVSVPHMVIAIGVVAIGAAIHLLTAPAAADLRTTARKLLPKPPADFRPQQAKAAADARRFTEAIAILEDYLEDRPEDGDARVLSGWCQYRVGRFDKARDSFAVVLKANPQSDDARVGLGYATLQTTGAEDGAKWFRQVLAKDALHRDALEGIILAGQREGASRALRTEAMKAARTLQSVSKTFRPEHLPAGLEKRLRGPASETEPLSVPARAVRDFIEIEESGVWRPVFIRGFNLGVALPGRFAAEFPRDQALYAGWLDAIGSMGANAVRIYTLLPPEFYRALKAHNSAHPNERLWLIQGVWTELPPDYDFSDPDYLAGFHAETARVIDAVHGNLVLGPRPGHAFGVYDVDASGSVLAYIIGREWEPFAVSEYNKLHAGEVDYEGTYFKVESARPMERWVAGVCNFAAEHEARHYRALHPLTFANWPTLDPLDHPTEANRAEEDYWREKHGVPFPPVLTGLPWEDDAVSLDATLIHPTEAMTAGFFAAYHIYPNYPEFMNTEPDYDRGRDDQGKDRYVAYLASLKAYHGEQPVLVAEFGISTSRGVAHVHPQGWNHGGLTETEQGELVSRMLRNIHSQRYAGGIVFEFLDEWFKSTWSVAPFESPADRRRMWFNAESPEESYGIMAARPNSARIVLDGKSDDWNRVPVLSSK